LEIKDLYKKEKKSDQGKFYLGIIELIKNNKSSIMNILGKIIDVYENLKKTSSTLDEIIKDHLNISKDLKILKIENIQKEEFENGIMKEEMIQDIIQVIENSDSSLLPEIPDFIKKSIKLIIDDLKEFENDKLAFSQFQKYNDIIKNF
jgi:hypothetical protein